MPLLDRILQAKERELEELAKRRLPVPPALRPVALRRSPGQRLRIIAEIKRRSPSAGELSTRLSIAERASAYQRAGANMISVLCDAEFFAGDYEHLLEARQGSSLPLLCKEFVVSELQLDCARAHGADAVLLIVRCLSPNRLAELIGASVDRGLVPLVEVVTHDEARLALEAGAQFIGVNARDLDTLQMNPARAAEVLANLPEAVTAAHLSGLASPGDVRAVAGSRADAALIGEALMRQDDPEALLAEMVAAS